MAATTAPARRSSGVGGLPGRRAGPALLFAGLTFYLLLPMLAVFLYSVATVWRSQLLPDGYTLEHWISGLGDERLVFALLRSLGLATAVTVLDIVVVVPAIYWARVRNPRIRTLTEVAAVIPFALPFVVIAFGIDRLAGDFAPWLQSTPWILWLGHSAIAFPFLYWAVDGAMAAAGIERLSEAAETCGARPRQIIREVVIPNITPGLVAGGILVWATSFGDFALAQILTGPNFETVPIWQADALLQTTGQANELAVITFVTFFILFALSAAIVYWNRGQVLRLLPGARAMERTEG